MKKLQLLTVLIGIMALAAFGQSSMAGTMSANMERTMVNKAAEI